MASSRGFFVGGNLKMNGNASDMKAICERLGSATLDSKTDVVLFPPLLFILELRNALESQKKNKIELGAQNVFDKPCGAFTGEISASQLADAQIPWVLTGHSERREVIGEGDEFVASKTKAALSNGLRVVLCCGETLSQREANETLKIVERQLDCVFSSSESSEKDGPTDWASKVVIAYEPVWAIGTGKVATADQAQEVHAHIRQWIATRLGDATAAKIRIIYGGSVTDKNCVELANEKDVDGFLVGGASLKPAFVDIINARQTKS